MRASTKIVPLVIVLSPLLVLLPQTHFGQVEKVTPLTAPTYYVVLRGSGCTNDRIEVHGATNLPAGSILSVSANEFDGTGWIPVSEENWARVDSHGFFRAKLLATSGHNFRRNQLLQATFAPYTKGQPESSLIAAGKKGERLGDLENPQVSWESGGVRILSAIDLIGAC